jgi:hypothetical protein
MHRQFSLQPFSRHYSHSTNPFLDFLEIENDDAASRSTPRISVTPEKRADLLEVLTMYKAVQAAGTMLTLAFVTVNDYLWLLRAVSQELAVFRSRVLYYLAAAVSDFFLPRRKMVSNRSENLVPWANCIFFRSLSIKSSRAKATCLLKWTRYPKFSNPWLTNGHQRDISCHSR